MLHGGCLPSFALHTCISRCCVAAAGIARRRSAPQLAQLLALVMPAAVVAVTTRTNRTAWVEISVSCAAQAAAGRDVAGDGAQRAAGPPADAGRSHRGCL